MKDGRNRLRAHWPPRRIQVVQVTLDSGMYERLYEAAKRKNISLAAEIMQRLDNPKCPTS